MSATDTIAEDFTVRSLYETDRVVINKNTPEDEYEDIWYTVVIKPGATVEEIQTAFNNLPETAEYEDTEVQDDGTVWMDFSR